MLNGQAVIRADASSQMGAGHLARCLTLAEVFRTAGVATEFAVADSMLSEWVVERGFAVHVLQCPPGGEEDLRKTRDLAAMQRAALVVVDGYQFGSTYSAALHDAGFFTCCVDDLADQTFACDVVLNGNVYAPRLEYRVAPYCEVLAGPRYALIRDAFIEAREKRESSRDQADRVLVTMGAADPDGWTERVLGALADVRKRLEVRVVRGMANTREDDVLDAARALAGAHSVEVLEQVTNLAQHMLWCDVAVTAGGTTCLELACVGVPAIAIAIADNQRPVVAELDRLRAMLAVGADVRRVSESLAQLLDSTAMRTTMASEQRLLVDGQGKHRAVRRILELVRQQDGATE